MATVAEINAAQARAATALTGIAADVSGVKDDTTKLSADAQAIIAALTDLRNNPPSGGIKPEDLDAVLAQANALGDSAAAIDTDVQGIHAQTSSISASLEGATAPPAPNPNPAVAAQQPLNQFGPDTVVTDVSPKTPTGNPDEAPTPAPGSVPLPAKRNPDGSPAG